MVGNILMDGADQVRGLSVVELETELAVGVGFGAAGLFHAGAEFEENNFVSGGGLVGGGVFYGAGEGLGGAREVRRRAEMP